jgi:acetolactate synthase-1/2/3 large subunit
MPFATTTMAKGLIDENHPLSIGCIERGRRQIQRRFIQGADLIVGLGYDTIEVEYEAWAGDVPVLNIDIDRADVSDSVRVVHEVTGDVGAALAGLNTQPAAANQWPEDTAGAHRTAYQASLRPDSAAFCPHQAIDRVRAALPADGVLAFDVGAHTHQIAGQWQATGPRRFLITNGWSSMGFGLPAAIAAKLARPDLQVACVLGDGCFQMTCGELATAKRAGLTLPVVVLDDTLLGLIVIKQQQRQFGDYGTALGDRTAAPPAHYFGVPAKLALTAEALDTALAEAFAADGPTVIHAAVDPAHYFETVFD